MLTFLDFDSLYQINDWFTYYYWFICSYKFVIIIYAVFYLFTFRSCMFAAAILSKIICAISYLCIIRFVALVTMRLCLIILVASYLDAWSSMAQSASVADKDHLLLVLITKVHAFRRRLYKSYLSQSVEFINRNKTMSFHGRYQLTYLHIESIEFSPPDVLRMLCDSILLKKASLIFYLSEQDSIDYKSASAEFLLQTANFLGLPVIVLAEDNSGIVQVCSDCKRYWTII